MSNGNDDPVVFVGAWIKEGKDGKFTAGFGDADQATRIGELPGFFEDGFDVTISKNRNKKQENSPDFWLIFKPRWKPSGQRSGGGGGSRGRGRQSDFDDSDTPF